jgi:hypothetical protein
MSLATVAKLIALAADDRGNLNERQNAALKACEMMKREGLVVHDPDPWDVRDRHHFPKDPRVDCTCRADGGTRGPQHAASCAWYDHHSPNYESTFRVNIEDIFGYPRYHSPPHDDFVDASRAAAAGQREAERRRREQAQTEKSRLWDLWESKLRDDDPKVQAQKAYAKGFDAIDWEKR